MELAAGMTVFETSRIGRREAVLRETAWGYILRGAGVRGRVDDAIWAGIRFLGLVLVLSAYGQWLLPAALFPGDVFVAKATISFFLGLAGVGLYWTGGRRVRTDLHVDLGRRELGLAERNGRGQVRLRRMIPMSEVDAVYVARPAGHGELARLYLTFKGTSKPLEISRGPEPEILEIHRRLADDLRPPVMRIALKLAKTVPFRSCRTA